MGSTYLLPEALLYPIVAEMADGYLHNIARDIKRNADNNLAQAQATTEHTKLPVPMVRRQQASGLTDIGLDTVPAKYGNDYSIWMEGGEDDQAAMAIEMGHDPSGYFKGHRGVKSSRGLFILTRAAGLTMLSRFGR
jgi:hypothetical protein